MCFSLTQMPSSNLDVILEPKKIEQKKDQLLTKHLNLKYQISEGTAICDTLPLSIPPHTNSIRLLLIKEDDRGF